MGGEIVLLEYPPQTGTLARILGRRQRYLNVIVSELSTFAIWFVARLGDGNREARRRKNATEMKATVVTCGAGDSIELDRSVLDRRAARVAHVT